jgi:hypothetical protein
MYSSYGMRHQRVQPQTLYMKNVDDMKKSLAFYKHIE